MKSVVFIILLMFVLSSGFVKGLSQNNLDRFDPVSTQNDGSEWLCSGVTGIKKVDYSQLDERNDTAFIKGTHKPFTGIAYMKFSNGKISLETPYINGRIKGTEKSYFSSGKMKYSADYTDGKYNGKLIYYYETGHIKSSETYKMDFKYGPAVYYYPNGNKQKKGNYYDCRETGEWIEYYENGKIKSKGNYVDAEKTGKWIYYTLSGKIKETVIYEKKKEKPVLIKL